MRQASTGQQSGGVRTPVTTYSHSPYSMQGIIVNDSGSPLSESGYGNFRNANGSVPVQRTSPMIASQTSATWEASGDYAPSSSYTGESSNPIQIGSAPTVVMRTRRSRQSPMARPESLHSGGPTSPIGALPPRTPTQGREEPGFESSAPRSASNRIQLPSPMAHQGGYSAPSYSHGNYQHPPQYASPPPAPLNQGMSKSNGAAPSYAPAGFNAPGPMSHSGSGSGFYNAPPPGMRSSPHPGSYGDRRGSHHGSPLAPPAPNGGSAFGGLAGMGSPHTHQVPSYSAPPYPGPSGSPHVGSAVSAGFSDYTVSESYNSKTLSAMMDETSSGKSGSSASSVRDDLPLCPNDDACALINDRKHQKKFAHTCRLFPCYHGHITRHAKLFRHAPGQITQTEGVQQGTKMSSHALASVNFATISPEAPGAFRIYVSHGDKSYEIFGDWANVKVHTFKRYLNQVYHIPPSAQVLSVLKTGKVMDDELGPVKSYGIEENAVILLKSILDEPAKMRIPLEDL